jgi:hypothetical protein
MKQTTKMGRPHKFAEKSKIYSVRLPESKYQELKAELDKVVLSLIKTS